MKKVSRIRITEYCFLILLFGLFSPANAQKIQRLPNIIYILADDLGYADLGCYGQQKIKTPNIDQLAAKGKRFTSFYAGSTVCAPSRAALMTGKHTGHVSIRGNGEFPLPQDEKTITELLKERGYVNGMMGKWGLGLAGTSGSPETRGWDYFSGHVHHVEGHFQKPDSAWKIKDKVLEKTKIPANLYVNEWFTNEALEFITTEKEHPFFLYLSFTLPHAELVVPDQYIKPYLKENGESIFAPERPHLPGQHYGPQPAPRAAYAAMVTQMDDYVGKIVQQIHALGLDEETIIIFTSDNGTHKEGGRSLEDATQFFQSSGPFKGIKRDLYEGGIRVPFIIRWDTKIEQASYTDVPAASWDLMASLAAIAEIQPPENDGISLVPIWKNTASKKMLSTFANRIFYWEFYEQGYKQAVRQGNWKAIRFYSNGLPIRTELYNLRTDKGETTDLSSNHTKEVKALEKIMDKERKPSPNKAFQIR